MYLLNKRGVEIPLETVIFIFLNIVFVGGVLLLFVAKSSTGAVIYEQAYAKQIALSIDSAQPNSTILIDMQKGVALAQQQGKDRAFLVRIDNAKKEIFVSLTPRGGYSFHYFSDASVSVRSDLTKGTNLIIGVES